MKFNLAIKNVRELTQFTNAIETIESATKGVRHTRRDRVRRMTNEELDALLDACGKVPVVLRGIGSVKVDIEAESHIKDAA